jgi:hypothetical protein
MFLTQGNSMIEDKLKYTYSHTKHKIIETYEMSNKTLCIHISKDDFFKSWEIIKDYIDDKNVLRVEWKSIEKDNNSITKIRCFIRIIQHLGLCIRIGKKYFFDNNKKDMDTILITQWNKLVNS